MRVSFLLALALCATPALSSEDEHDGEYEWAGIFDVSEYDTVNWIAQKVDGDYADPLMGLVVAAASGGSHEDLESAEHDMVDLLNGHCVRTPTNETMTPSTSVCYRLKFDPYRFESVWDIDVSGTDYIVFFAEHVPIEFEDTTHYLRGIDGTDIEPLHELPEGEEPEKPWGEVILACVLVNLMTFVGVALLGCGLVPSKITPTQHGGLSGFASGALLACAVFLILAEGLYLIGAGVNEDESIEEGDRESVTVFRWGASFIGGFLTALVLYLAEPGALKLPTSKVAAEGEAQDADQANKMLTTLFSICIGDFFHNLVDGFAIGFAFKMCTDAETSDGVTGWTILFATMYHEIAQEIGDFCLLTHDIGYSVPMALLWNFLSGTSVIIGGLISVGADISDEATGILLAFGGGTYVYLATTEALPRALGYSDQLEGKASSDVKKHYAVVLASFLLGAVLIGIVLTNHKHCVPGGGGHAH